MVKSAEEPALFVDSKYGSRLEGTAVALIVKRAAQRSGVNKRVFPHMFRFSMATHLLRNGADLRHIQAILGHSKIESTEVYTQLTAEDLKAMMKKRHPHRMRPKN